MMFILTIVSLALVVVASSSAEVPLLNQLLNLKPDLDASDSMPVADPSSSSNTPKLLAFPFISTEKKEAHSVKDFPLMNVEKKVKTYTTFPPLFTTEENKHHSELLPAMKNPKSAASNHNLPIVSEPKVAATPIPLMITNDKHADLEPSVLSAESAAATAVFPFGMNAIATPLKANAPQSNFEKISLAQPKALRTRAEVSDKKATELPFVKFSLRGTK